MRTILRAALLALTALCTPSWAAPTCYPPTALQWDFGATPASIPTSTTTSPYWIMWKCSNGGLNIVFYTLAEAMPWGPEIQARAVDPAKAAAAWATGIPLTPAESGLFRKLAVERFGLAAVVTVTTAYRRNEGTNTPPTYTPIGTVPLNTVCSRTSEVVGDKMRVDRTKVKLASPSLPMPPTAYAVCG